MKGVEEVVDEFTHGNADGFMSCVVAILFFGTVYALEAVGRSVFFAPWVRSFLADYAYPVCTPPSPAFRDELIMIGRNYLLGRVLPYPWHPRRGTHHEAAHH